MKNINLNDPVWVVLTDRGAAILNQITFEMKARFPRWESPMPRSRGDVHQSQMWCLMQDFGPSTMAGMRPFFIGNRIFLEKPSRAAIQDLLERCEHD